MTKLDEQDRLIIAALQENGRLSNMEIANRVNLSHSSCSRRIARLEKDGVIVGYRALTDRRKLGYTVHAFCEIVRDPSISWAELAEQMKDIEGVVSVYAVSGSVDIMVEIVAEDMPHYSEVVLQNLSCTPGVSAVQSTFVLAEIKSLY
ncbi:Lrp/AsnC family transcriptional regulator [Oleidesulfovibrio sp.]|uniref:Lrp/AsnC family transcriptional regulator n=1 Tax=Oleidesulfovibrio sp. TaxID=2909707 RepID=UPI003A85F11A